MKPLPHKQHLGKIGENLAASYLQRKGYVLIDRNFKARYGEIDLICTKDNTLIFVEVKTRIGQSYGKPEEAVTTRKLAEVIKTAQYYASLHTALPEAQRIDVIAIEMATDNKIVSFRHLESVT